MALTAEVAVAEGPLTAAEEEQQLGASGDPAKVKEALEAGIHAELSKSTQEDMEAAFGPMDADEVWDEDKYGEITPEEREAFRYVKSLTKHYEKMTGKKIVPDLNKVWDSAPGASSDISSTLAEMQELGKKMNGGKEPKVKDVVQLTSHADFLKELGKVRVEQKYAFGGIPPATHPGGGRAESTKQYGPEFDEALPTSDEKARQAALQMSAARSKAKADKEEAKLEDAEAKKMDTNEAEAGLDVYGLLQVGESDDPSKRPVEGKADEFASEAEVQARKQEAADAAQAKKKPAGSPKMKKIDERLHALEGFIKRHSAQTKEAVLQSKETPTETRARQRDNMDKVQAVDQVEAEATGVKGLETDPEAKAGLEINCDNAADLACLKKKAAELGAKAKVAKHRAYDLQRAAADSATKGTDEATQLQADNEAEQEMVVAAFMSSQADRAKTVVQRLLSKSDEKEKHTKLLMRQQLADKSDPMNTPIGFDHLGRPYEDEKPLDTDMAMTAPDGEHRDGKHDEEEVTPVVDASVTVTVDAKKKAAAKTKGAPVVTQIKAGMKVEPGSVELDAAAKEAPAPAEKPAEKPAAAEKAAEKAAPAM